MPVAAEDIATLSRLLDQALDLDAAQREDWLAALAPEHQRLATQLREMLAERVDGDAESPLSALPRLAADDELARAGELVGPYRLLREIGRGGMGSVWLAERADGRFKRQVALKLPRLAWGAGLAERMAREREIGMLLEHPAIARLYDAGLDERGRPYLALEYIDGQPLDVWCKAQALDVRARLRLFLQVVMAVAYAHGRLVVHRDLKPSNVLVSADGQAHLLDFGIAKLLGDAASGDAGLTQQQGQVLTPHYAAPEQVAGETITVQTDVYALGVLLYELLTGTRPIEPRRASLGAVEDAIMQGDAPPASGRVKDTALARALRGELDAILGKAMQREPARRYVTAEALARDIERHLNGETVAARPDSAACRLVKALRRHRIAFSAAGAVALAILGGAGVSVIQANRANDAADRARVVKEFVVDVFKVNLRSLDNHELRQMPAEMLLERGARLVDMKFSTQPRMQAELFGVVAGIFGDMGAADLGLRYAQRRIDALDRLQSGGEERASAMLALGRSYLNNGRPGEAGVAAHEALRLAEAQATLRRAARSLLAEALMGEGKVADAVAELDALDADLGAAGAKPSVERARSLQMRAYMLSDRGEYDEAIKTMNAGVEEAFAAEGSGSPAAIRMLGNLATGLNELSRYDEARSYRERLLAAMRAVGGPDDIDAAITEAYLTKQLFFSRRESLETTVAAIERARALLAGKAGLMPKSIAARMERELGHVYLEWGWVDRAAPLIASSALALREAAAASPRAQWEQATVEQELAYMAGHHSDADRFGREALRAHRTWIPNHTSWIGDYESVALNLAAMGLHDEAQAVLDSAPPLDPWKSTGSDQSAGVAGLNAVRARLLLDRGAASQALALLRGTPSYSNELPLLRRNVLLGEALCAADDPSGGLELMVVATEELARARYKDDPVLARVRATAGLCAFSAGRKPLALTLADEARRAFRAQPGVSPYFKAPLAKLEQALRSRRTAT